MAKGKVPSMLSLQNGPMSCIIAKHASKCSRCKDAILGGSRCGEMKTIKGGFTTPRRLCLTCCNEIVEATRSDIENIAQQLA
jgi:hypothetical protein